LNFHGLAPVVCNTFFSCFVNVLYIQDDILITDLNLYFQQGIGVELIRILPETHPPTVTNVFAEADSKDDVVSCQSC